MKTSPIEPARIGLSADGLPMALGFGDVYHPRSGALAQARHVFLAGNGLPERWRGRERFVIAETGFGLGNNFLATWAAWRADAQRSDRLDFLSVELHPPTREDLGAWPRDEQTAALADELQRQWPPLLHGLHRLCFDAGRVTLHLAFGDAATWAREWVASVDAFFLDGFAPDRNPPMWDGRLIKALARLAAVQATAATWSAARPVRDALQAAGFEVSKAPGQGGKRDITVAHFAPRGSVRSAPPGRPRTRGVERRALIVGGGLAGCAAAWALAEQGWHGSVFDRHEEPACEGSGNPAGIFHGVVTPDDGVHARWHRAAALAFAPVARAAVREGVRGAVDGLLRLDPDVPGVDDMAARLRRLGLPPEYVQAVSAPQASLLAGMPLAHAAWFYPGGGWIDPRALAAWYLRRAGASVRWHGGEAVMALRRDGDDWVLLSAQGLELARASTVVLACAGESARLAGMDTGIVEPIRGQVSIADAPPLRLPRLPLAGSGYVLPTLGRLAIFGATAQRGDDATAVRVADHADNLKRLVQLTGVTADVRPESLQGRVGWRWTAADRLPLIGAVPDPMLPAVGSADQPRLLPRQEGLFVFSALGSRGIGISALGARLLAAWVTGAPSPVEAGLMDAVDPARFAARARRRATTAPRPAAAAE